MICMIYRRKRVTDGKTETARLYRGRYRLEGEAKITEVPLHTSDKRVAQQRLEEIVKQRQQEAAGMIPGAGRRRQLPMASRIYQNLFGARYSDPGAACAR